MLCRDVLRRTLDCVPDLVDNCCNSRGDNISSTVVNLFSTIISANGLRKENRVQGLISVNCGIVFSFFFVGVVVSFSPFFLLESKSKIVVTSFFRFHFDLSSCAILQSSSISQKSSFV